MEKHLFYRGMDGREYYSSESLAEANRFYIEINFPRRSNFKERELLNSELENKDLINILNKTKTL